LWAVEADVTAHVLSYFGQLPGVVRGEIVSDDWTAAAQRSMWVFWMRDLDAVFAAVADRIQALRIESVGREGSG